MGAFFTNVHVRSTALDTLLAALRADASHRGFDEVDGTEPADRSVVVLLPQDGWITIYDEATEGQHPEPLDALAKVATRATSALGFSTLVHDSDVLDLHLYRGGTPIDHLCTDPSYFARGRSKKKTAGDPAAWAELADPVKIAEAFRDEALFAERTLGQIVELVGVDRERAFMGFRYFETDVAARSAQAVRLSFRDRVRPAWSQTSDGPPRLDLGAHPGDRALVLAVPDELRVSVGARSTGRASVGLEVRAWGSALDRGLVTIERFELVLGDPLKDRRVVQLEARSAADAAGAPMRVATSEDLALPAGTADAFAGAGPGTDVLKMMEAMRRSTVHVNVIGRCVAPGDGELGVALIPRETPDAHAATIARLEISAPLRRPLRFDERLASQPGGTAHLLAPLSGDRWHVALLVSDRSRTELATIARGMVDDARGVIGEAEMRTAIFRAAPGQRPSDGRSKSRTLLGGKRFETLIGNMASEQLVTLTALAGRDTHFGLGIGTGVLPHHEGERVPVILAWLDAAHPDGAAVRDRWAGRFDAEMASGHGLQAMTTRTGWQPAHPDGTAYETACGIAHGVGSLREWAAKWLRVPGNDRTWLSSAMATRLGDRRALDAIADVVSLGGALRITLRERARHAELERALGELLPTSEVSHEVIRAFFARHA